MVRGMSAHNCGHAPCISQQEITSQGILLCVNNIIIMCIGLVHDIFTRNIYDGRPIDRKIDN